MIKLSTFSNRMAAAVAAFALSLSMFATTVATPAAHAHTAFVGVIA